MADGNECVLASPEEVPAGQCLKSEDTFYGSSGYRKIPGNTCQPPSGPKRDDPIKKSCAEGKAKSGQVTHQRTEFDSLIRDQAYFGDSHVRRLVFDHVTSIG